MAMNCCFSDFILTPDLFKGIAKRGYKASVIFHDDICLKIQAEVPSTVPRICSTIARNIVTENTPFTHGNTAFFWHLIPKSNKIRSIDINIISSNIMRTLIETLNTMQLELISVAGSKQYDSKLNGSQLQWLNQPSVSIAGDSKKQKSKSTIFFENLPRSIKFAFVGLMVFFLSVTLNQNYTAFQLDNQWAANREARSVIQDFAQFGGAAAYVKQHDKHHKKVVLAIANIASLLDKKSWLSSFTVTDQTITVTGFTPSVKSAIDTLQQSQFLSNPQIIETEKSSKFSGRDTFTVEFDL